MGRAAIEVSGLTKTFPLYRSPFHRALEAVDPFRRQLHRDFYAVRDLTFSVPRGQSLGIVGRNGSGKSTLLKLVTGVLTPTRGSVAVNGRISALLELGAGFNPELTGIENVFFTGAIMGLSRAKIQSVLDDIVAFADIGDYVRQPVKRYSSGMFVRLAFAVAVHVEPELLIVDEALSVGDMRFQQKCYRRINEFKAAGVTILFVTHDTGALMNFCDRCLWLRDGALEQDGTPGDVVRAYSAFMAYDAEDVRPAAPRTQGAPKPSDAQGDRAVEDPIPWETVDACASFGDAGAKVLRAALSLTGASQPVTLLRGGEDVTVSMDVLFHRDIALPLYGFLVKDKYGSHILTVNSFTYEMDCAPRTHGERVHFHFSFRMPTLRLGEYSISVAIAEGTQAAHTQHHYVHDALLFQIANPSLKYLPGAQYVVDAKLREATA